MDTAPTAQVFRKGTDPRIDSYRAFFDKGHRKATGLADYLKARAVTEICIAGLALDYCVKFTVLDACRGIALEQGDLEKALDEMKWSGATLLQSRALR